MPTVIKMVVIAKRSLRDASLRSVCQDNKVSSNVIYHMNYQM